MALSTPSVATSGNNGSANTVRTTGSFTPSANAILFAAFHAQGAGSPNDPTYSDTSTLTWNNLYTSAFNTSNRLTIKWAEVGASPAAMTITADYGGFSTTQASWGVVALTGYDTGTPIVTGSNVSGSGTSTTPAPSTAVPALAAAGNFQLFFEAARTASSSAKAGWTELLDQNGGTLSQLGCYYIGTPGDTSPSSTLSGSAIWRAYALEVAEAAAPSSVSGVGTTPRRQALVRRVVVL